MHSTLKVPVYDDGNDKWIAGTMYVPGQRKKLDLWYTVGSTWEKKNVDTDFLRWGFVECQIAVKATRGLAV